MPDRASGAAEPHDPHGRDFGNLAHIWVRFQIGSRPRLHIRQPLLRATLPVRDRRPPGPNQKGCNSARRARRTALAGLAQGVVGASTGSRTCASAKARPDGHAAAGVWPWWR